MVSCDRPEWPGETEPPGYSFGSLRTHFRPICSITGRFASPHVTHVFPLAFDIAEHPQPFVPITDPSAALSGSEANRQSEHPVADRTIAPPLRRSHDCSSAQRTRRLHVSHQPGDGGHGSPIGDDHTGATSAKLDRHDDGYVEHFDASVRISSSDHAGISHFDATVRRHLRPSFRFRGS